jgi:hypothetical protein
MYHQVTLQFVQQLLSKYPIKIGSYYPWNSPKEDACFWKQGDFIGKNSPIEMRGQIGK